jgi:GntR family transcriptional regulator
MSTIGRAGLTRSTFAQQIRDDLRQRIRSGELASGAKLPSEAECCEIYGVSRPTVREALRLLENDGLLEVRHGSGRFVLPGGTAVVHGWVNFVRSTHATLEDLGYHPTIEVLGTEVRTASAEEASFFGFDDGGTVVEVARAYVSGRELLTHAVNVLDVARLPSSLEDMNWATSLAATYAEHGREISSGYSDISAVQLPSHLAGRFDVSDEMAWLGFDGPFSDQLGMPLWWSRELWRGDLRPFRVVNRFDSED